jgi:hypothetical protein
VGQAAAPALQGHPAGPQLFTLADNLANFLRKPALPKPIWRSTLRALGEKPVTIGARVVRHAKHIVFQLPEVALTRQIVAAILERIGQLRLASASG